MKQPTRSSTKKLRPKDLDIGAIEWRLLEIEAIEQHMADKRVRRLNAFSRGLSSMWYLQERRRCSVGFDFCVKRRIRGQRDLVQKKKIKIERDCGERINLGVGA